MNFKKQAIFILICASLVSSAIFTTHTVQATIDVYPGPGTPIQDAINAAPHNATIHVHAGIYNEVINLQKNVSLAGDSAATTIIDGTGKTGPVVTLDLGYSPGYLNFSNFTIRGAPVDGSGESFGMLAKQSTPNVDVAYTISDCRFVGTNNPAASGEFQFYETGGQEDVVFTRNVITQYSGNAFVSELHTGATEISNNTFDAPLNTPPSSPADVIFFMTYGAVDVGNLQNISYNVFNMGTANQKSTAVSISAPGAGAGNAVWSNVLIEGNTFNTLKNNGRAIGFWADGGNNIVNPIVTKNAIIGVPGSLNSYGIFFYDPNGGTTSGATISCNTITGMDYGIILRHIAGLSDAPGTTIYNNNIVGNTIGIDWSWTNNVFGWVNATNNWWGNASGPSGSGFVGPGTGDPVTVGVNFDPWLRSPAQWPSLYLNPSQVNKVPADMGTYFTVAVTLSNFTRLAGFGINMTWDDSLITFVSANATTLNSIWPSGWTPIRNQSGTGYYDIAVSSDSGLAGNNTGASMLFNMRFQVTKSWTSELSTPIHFALADLADNSTPISGPILPITTDGTYTMDIMTPGLEFKVEKRNKFTGANVTIDPPYHFESRYYFHFDVYVTNVGALANYSMRIDFTTGFVDFKGIEYWGVFGAGNVSYTPGGSVIIVNGSGSAWSGSEGLLCKLTFYVNFTVVPEHIWKYGSTNYETFPISVTDAKLGFGSLGEIPYGGIIVPSALSMQVDFIRGDVNCDGAVTMADISSVAYYYGQAVSPAPSQFDLTNDNFIDIYDIVTIATNYLYGTHA